MNKYDQNGNITYLQKNVLCNNTQIFINVPVKVQKCKSP